MTTVDDGRRVARGEKGLLAQYRKRARSLVADPEFAEAIDTIRRQWVKLHPSIGLGDHDIARPLPSCTSNRETMMGFLANAVIELAIAKHETEASTMRTALNDWRGLALGIAERFWPALYFRNPREPSHPALLFIDACMTYDRPQRLEGWIVGLFPLFDELTLIPTFEDFMYPRRGARSLFYAGMSEDRAKSAGLEMRKLLELEATRRPRGCLRRGNRAYSRATP